LRPLRTSLRHRKGLEVGKSLLTTLTSEACWSFAPAARAPRPSAASRSSPRLPPEEVRSVKRLLSYTYALSEIERRANDEEQLF
jgi:hypothetical protein